MAQSAEARALRKSYEVFKKGVDPANLVTLLYSRELLTPEEKTKATNRSSSSDEKLEELFASMERRVSAKPPDFHKLVKALKDEPALKPVADQMQS